ncbi:MAG TPA: sigma 54-interacting transcriptional regulator [Chitinispirillaceae bacterium]|nr:sigma 54-interacting transcriptional regulator [Chitinispirillaceae bacterium]
MKGLLCLFDSIQMKATNLNIAELIQFSPGFVGIQGRRLLIHDLSSLGQFRRDLIESIGDEMARRILTRKGLFWGQADCSGMKRLFNWEDKHELIRAVAELMKIIGMAYAEVTKLRLDNDAIEIKIQCADSVEVEQYRNEFGKSLQPVCWVITGYLSGYVSCCLGKNIYFSESLCHGAEASSCTFIGKDLQSWGDAFNKELPFFEAADIQKKVQQLSLRIVEQQRELAKKQKQLKAVQKLTDLAGIETRSKSYKNVLDLASRVASFDTTILITGETGSGKEVLARYIHEISNRKDFPFLAVNCSALPESLLENELFGHKAGAFTGARNNEVGLFEAAQQGTIFLDEIGDISLATQAKLLRVLQSKEIRPVGDTHPQLIDVRVISATNQDLDLLVKEGRFRKDLLYRLRVLQIMVPPLRERPDDILPLTRHFLERFRRKLNITTLRLATETVDLLFSYQWPGNVRELENALEHAAILCTDGYITPETLPGTINGRSIINSTSNEQKSLEQIELEYIDSALNLTGGNRTEAAKILKISESTLYRRLRKLNKQKQEN